MPSNKSFAVGNNYREIPRYTKKYVAEVQDYVGSQTGFNLRDVMAASAEAHMQAEAERSGYNTIGDLITRMDS